MDRNKEREGIDDLINHLDGWSLARCGESPDFIIENDSTHCLVGVEVTEYYPNRTPKGVALVRIPGKDKTETRRNNLRFFEETESRILWIIASGKKKENLICIKGMPLIVKSSGFLL